MTNFCHLPQDLDQFADEHGYIQLRCPECRRIYWTDGRPVCEHCGAEEDIPPGGVD